jgi:hypothetical protein
MLPYNKQQEVDLSSTSQPQQGYLCWKENQKLNCAAYSAVQSLKELEKAMESVKATHHLYIRDPRLLTGP